MKHTYWNYSYRYRKENVFVTHLASFYDNNFEFFRVLFMKKTITISICTFLILISFSATMEIWNTYN